ncbi:MAG: hypothetical protein ACRC10_00515 [Thermoguttaceae bacterium]
MMNTSLPILLEQESHRPSALRQKKFWDYLHTWRTFLFQKFCQASAGEVCAETIQVF